MKFFEILNIILIYINTIIDMDLFINAIIYHFMIQKILLDKKEFILLKI